MKVGSDFRLSTLLFALFLFSIAMGGCANPGIVNLGHDKYMLYKEDHAGIFGSAERLRAEVIEQADEFAKSKGKVAYPLAAKSKPLQLCAACWATFEYHFLLVNENDNTTPKTRLIPGTDVVTDDAGNISGEVYSKPVDIHTELLKFDELRKKKIISEAEFEEQKKKLLK